MCVGLYVAETPDIRCLFDKTPALNKTPVYYHNVAHSNPISCCGPINIFSSANKQQGNSADCSDENPLRYYACFVSNLLKIRLEYSADSL